MIDMIIVGALTGDCGYGPVIACLMYLLILIDLKARKTSKLHTDWGKVYIFLSFFWPLLLLVVAFLLYGSNIIRKHLTGKSMDLRLYGD